MRIPIPELPSGWRKCEPCDGAGWFQNEEGFYRGTCEACDGKGGFPLPFEKETDLVAEFIDQLNKDYRDNPWTVYPETAGWDLLLVHKEGFQLGIEAKLSLNAKVIDQALVNQHSSYLQGPDYRAVLVPADKVQHHLGNICAAIGLGMISIRRQQRGCTYGLNLPNEDYSWREWPNWCPGERCALPDYVPDVAAGDKSPVMLTHWKIKAIKLMILLERNGVVHRGDMKALQISPSRWTDAWHGFLDRTPNGFVKNERTPDLRAQHPVNYAEIEADFDNWNPYRTVAA